MAEMDMTLAAQSLVNLFVNMDHVDRVVFIRLLITEIKDEEVDLVLQVIDLRQKSEHSDSTDVSNFLDIELHDEGEDPDLLSHGEDPDILSHVELKQEPEEDMVLGGSSQQYDANSFLESYNYTDQKIEAHEGFYETGKSSPHKLGGGGVVRNHKKWFEDSRNHMIDIDPIDVKQERKYYYCDKCSKKYGQKGDLLKHVEIEHEGIRYPCDGCDYKATKKWNLRKHVESAHQGIITEKKNNEKRFICDQCSKKFVQKGDLMRHLEEIHKGVRYPCSECDFKASKKWHLKQHVESTHKGILYPCGQCDYSAKTKQTLQRHVESIHEGIRYPCDYCSYKATQKICLKKHFQLMHRHLESI